MRTRAVMLLMVVVFAVGGLVVIRLGAHPGAGAPLGLLPALSPEQAAQRQIQCPPPLQLAPGTFQVEGQRGVAPGSVVVFYRAECSAPGQPSLFHRGDSATRLTWWGWQATGGSASDSPVAPQPGGGPPSYALRSFSRHTLDGGPAGRAQAQGAIDAPDGTTVEATLSDGSVVQDQTRAGIFVFVLPDTLAVCSLRALDPAGQVAAQLDLPSGPGGLPGGPPACPP